MYYKNQMNKQKNISKIFINNNKNYNNNINKNQLNSLIKYIRIFKIIMIYRYSVIHFFKEHNLGNYNFFYIHIYLK